MIEIPTLKGRHVRLEPLSLAHAEGLAAASAADPSLYKWSLVPQGADAVARYINAALTLQRAGTTIAFATVRVADDVVIGSTRFFDLERWPWPEGHERHGLATPDVCEIGYTWLAKSAIRTAANTEAKFLMLAHAFESWKLLRVCLHTDARNEQSRAAMERIGAKFDGILRAHRMAADYIPRDSSRYSMVAADWPDVKRGLEGLLGD